MRNSAGGCVIDGVRGVVDGGRGCCCCGGWDFGEGGSWERTSRVANAAAWNKIILFILFLNKIQISEDILELDFFDNFVFELED